MKKIVFSILLVLLASHLAFAAELKIGHFDLQRLITQSNSGKDAREKLQARTKSYQHEIDTRTDKLKKMKEEIDAETKRLRANEKPPQRLVDKEKDYAAQYRDLQRLLGGYKDELKVYEAELTRKVLEELAPVVADFAKANRYDYLFKLNESFAFASDRHDVTNELVNEFNRRKR